MDNYRRGVLLGQGTYGVVYLATKLDTDERVALKKIRIGATRAQEGVTFTALRELKYLRELHHENILRLLDVFMHNINVYAVFDLMYMDLERVIRARRVPLPLADVKSYVHMLLNGVAHLHSSWILHRDLKPNNLLLSASGQLKLADFGLARTFASPRKPMTHRSVTRWYRAPELLFGARFYGAAVDMWSVGCIVAELLLRAPFLPGDSDMDQLSRIFHALGTPTDAEWPSMRALPNYAEFKACVRPPLRATFSAASDDLLSLLECFFCFNPMQRLSAKDALQHEYFRLQPLASPLEQLSAHVLITEAATRLHREQEAQQKTNKTPSKRKKDGDDNDGDGFSTDDDDGVRGRGGIGEGGGEGNIDKDDGNNDNDDSGGGVSKRLNMNDL